MVPMVIAHMHFQSLQRFRGFGTNITEKQFASILVDISDMDIEGITSGEAFETCWALKLPYNGEYHRLVILLLFSPHHTKHHHTFMLIQTSGFHTFN